MEVHRANIGPTWVLTAQVGPMLATWTLLSGKVPRTARMADTLPVGSAVPEDLETV